MARQHTYQSVVRQAANGARFWATSDTGDNAFAGVVFEGDGAPARVATLLEVQDPEHPDDPSRKVAIPVFGLFVDMAVANDGTRFAAVKASEGDATLLVKETGEVLRLPGSRGNWAHAFGPNDRLYIQQSDAGLVSVYGFDGKPVKVPAADDPTVLVDLTYLMPYDSGSGIHHVDPDGQPVAGFTLRDETIVNGVGLSFAEQIGNWAAGQASVGLNGGIAIVNVATGKRLMWPVYTPHRARLAVIDGEALVSVSCDAPAPRPDAMPWQEYDPMPADAVDGARRAVHTVACSDGFDQGPGDLHWSYLDGSKPHFEGGAYAWRDYILGHPAAVIFHDTRDSIDAPQEYPINWPAPPDDLINHVERLEGAISKRFVGSMRELAVRTKAIFVLYHDANKAEATIPYGESGQPDPEELTKDQLPGIRQVLDLNAQGINALIGHQGYLALKPAGGAFVSLGSMDAAWRTEHWGLALYKRFGVRVMLTIPLWTGNPVGPGGAPAYPLREVAELFHYQTQLADRYSCVEFVMAFDWTRGGGPRDNPWLGRAWRKRVTSTPRPIAALPTPLAYVAPEVVVPPIVVPPDVVPPPVDEPDHGMSAGEKAAIAATAVGAAIAAAKLIEFIRNKVKAGNVARADGTLVTVEQYDTEIAAAREPVAEGIAVAERELAALTSSPRGGAPRPSRVLAEPVKAEPSQSGIDLE